MKNSFWILFLIVPAIFLSAKFFIDYLCWIISVSGEEAKIVFKTFKELFYITPYKYELGEYYILYKANELPNHSPISIFGSSPLKIGFANFYDWCLYSRFRKKYLKELQREERIKNEKLFAKQVQKDIDTYQKDNDVTLDIDIKYLSD